MADRSRGGGGRGRGERGGSSDRARGRGDRGGERGAFRGDRGDRGGGYRGDRGGGGGGGYRGDRGGGYRGDRGGGYRGDRGGGGYRGGGGRGGRGDYPPLETYTGPKMHNPRNLLGPPEGYEDQVQKSTRAAELPDISSLSLEQTTVLRPAYGTSGTPVKLVSNFFPIRLNNNVGIQRYAIKISKSDGSDVQGPKRRRVIQLLLQSPRLVDISKGNSLATDFKALLFTLGTLPDDKLAGKVRFVTEGQTTAAATAPEFNVELEHTGSLTSTDLVNWIVSPDINRMLPQKGDFVQALNIILGYPSKLAQMNGQAMMSIGANKHYALPAYSIPGQYPLQFPGHPEAETTHDLGAGFTAVRGFFVSVRMAAARLLLNVQVKSSPVFEPMLLTTWIRMFGAANGNNRKKTGVYIKGLRVHAVHTRLPKTVFDFARRGEGSSPHFTQVSGQQAYGAGADAVHFWRDTEGGAGYVSVAQYFKQTYPKFPFSDASFVVNVGNKANPNYIPADLCVILPGQPASKKLSAEQTKQMIRFAVRVPAANLQTIDTKGPQTLSLVSNTTHPMMKNFGLQIEHTLVGVPARQLPSINVSYQGKDVQPRDGSWNLIKAVFTRSGTPLRHWAVVLVSINGESLRDVSPASVTSELLGKMCQTMRNSGVVVDATNHILTARFNDGSEYAKDRQVEVIFQEILAATRASPQLVFFVLSSRNTDFYNRVKIWGELTHGISTICALQRVFSSGNPGNYGNIALKFNLKLGGTNHVMKSIPIIDQGRTMVVGIDVTHPSPGSAFGSPSVAAVVASIDKNLGQWPGELSTQSRPERKAVENIVSLAPAIRGRLQLWMKHNRGALPENILVYRDGVSEGQYGIVQREELPQIHKACAQLYGQAKMPKITIIIVSKRHNTRFYPIDEKGSDANGNPVCGTVVDRAVTEARLWDFYLQSHNAIKGTARPAHYVVVHDEIFREPRFGNKPGQSPAHASNADVLQALTHKLCLVFGRATKAVSIPAPVYYADLLAERARKYLHAQFDPTYEDLADTPTQRSRATQDRANTPSGVSEPTSAPIAVHPNLKDTMYYI